MATQANLLVTALVVSVLLFWRIPRKRYPPGPRRYPILGNLFDIPKTHAYKKFAQYSKDLDSDIIYLDAAGTPFIILNSLEASVELLDKRSIRYSSRTHTTMGHDLVGCQRLFVMLPYNDEWRESKRVMVKHLSAPDQTPIVSRIRDFVRKSLLPNFLTSPEDFLVHIKNGVGGSIISLAYGLPIRRVADPWVALADEGMQCVTAAIVPGKYAVDALPFLKYLPEWFPGAGFQKEARESREVLRRFFRNPFEATKKGMADGSVQPSFLSQSLEDASETDDKEYREKLLENVGGMFTAGGTDSSVTAVKTLVAVLLLYPEVQMKAQAEIDTVIGSSRLPDFDDKPNLPYINAVVKEVLRWQPPIPGGFPHMSTEDDTYKGYFIPKGSIVMGNTWAIMHDEKTFPDPSRFDPERFLTPLGQLRQDKNIPDPEIVATFGFGRRICPGMNVGLTGFWLAAVSIISCFNVSPQLNESGEPDVPKIEYLGKELIHPEPFKCRIKPRSKQATSLIQSEYDETSEYV
ncbi:cytochrome P450 [Macrolepiota fuliginosa MF-IS2]|uniref:Cytochrome P450 n=1 Tax=Macrolepiota fuliginosa MF-IS2 TaxID=1400762 RepID=A0A9P5X9L1_9AGAR|nr:cytochrome P450 [Macrolepiota fuliginosa MF-IS2]